MNWMFWQKQPQTQVNFLNQTTLMLTDFKFYESNAWCKPWNHQISLFTDVLDLFKHRNLEINDHRLLIPKSQIDAMLRQ